jgi:ribonuclease VapC
MIGPGYMLDASALLAFLKSEKPGGERVAAALGQIALMSAVNWCEVLGKLEDMGWPADADSRLKLLEARAVLQIVPFDEPAARIAASLRQPTREAGLSLADRSCLATARAQSVPVLTADRIWAGLDVGVVVELIR